MENPSRKNPKPLKQVSAIKGNIKKLKQSELVRKGASQALRQGEEYFKAIIQNSSDIIFVVDTLGVITYASPSVERVLGYRPDELIGKSALSMIASNDRPRAIADFAKALLEKEVLIPNVFCINHKNGTERILEGIGNNLLDNPTVAGFVMNVRDVTERKRVEMELIERTAALEERTREMEAANKELESFSYTVSHDLRAPLRAIDGYSRMILKQHAGKFDDDAIDKFNVIRDNIRVMGQLIDDLLAFSRVGRTELGTVPLDIGDMIGEVWGELKAANPDRRLTLKLAEISPCKGDRTLIREVLVNILANAVKFTRGRSEALIEVGEDKKEDKTVYYIRDNGAGFDMQYHDKMFCVFQRLHSDAEFDGTGVGLAIVQRIIQRHGGRVWAEGEVDKGATFYFTLPTRQE